MAINTAQLEGLMTGVLRFLDPEIPYSKSARELLKLTAATESHMGTYIRQIQGPARGIFQMEPATEADIWDSYLAFRTKLAEKVQKLRTMSGVFDLKGNIPYQIAMARLLYYRAPDPLPNGDDDQWMARYWKEVYNTELGKGIEEEAIRNFGHYVMGET